MSLILSLMLAPAQATDVDGVVGDLSYDGSLSETATSYTVGKPVSVSHSGGNITVNCIDTDKLSARLPYSITGSAEGPMEAAGKGILMKASGDGKGGGIVSTKMPSKSSSVASIDAPLTVNVPAGASAITVSQSGSGWVSVRNCSGALKITAGSGGLFASGAYTSASLSAAGGDVKFTQDSGAVLTGSSSFSAPGGSAILQFSSAQGGKLSAKGTQVTTQMMVSGTNETNVVAGTFGIGGPSIAVSAKNNVDITAP